MLKQGVKTINAEFIRTRALSQLSFVQFRPYASLFPGLLLSLTLMPKSKKTLETNGSYVFVPILPLPQGLRVLFRMWIYLDNQRCNFIQKKYGRARRLSRTHILLFGL